MNINELKKLSPDLIGSKITISNFIGTRKIFDIIGVISRTKNHTSKGRIIHYTITCTVNINNQVALCDAERTSLHVTDDWLNDGTLTIEADADHNLIVKLLYPEVANGTS